MGIEWGDDTLDDDRATEPNHGDVGARKQLSLVAKALNQCGPYQASLVKRIEALISSRDTLQAERNRMADENKGLIRERDILAETIGKLNSGTTDY